MKKKFYNTPKMDIIHHDIQNNIMVSSNPSGTGEDMPWETFEDKNSVWN